MNRHSSDLATALRVRTRQTTFTKLAQTVQGSVAVESEVMGLGVHEPPSQLHVSRVEMPLPWRPARNATVEGTPGNYDGLCSISSASSASSASSSLSLSPSSSHRDENTRYAQRSLPTDRRPLVALPVMIDIASISTSDASCHEWLERRPTRNRVESLTERHTRPQDSCTGEPRGKSEPADEFDAFNWFRQTLLPGRRPQRGVQREFTF